MAKRKKPSQLIDFAADMGTHEPAIDLTDFRKDRAQPPAPPPIPTIPKPRRRPTKPPNPTAPHIDIYNTRDIKNIDNLYVDDNIMNLINIETKITQTEANFLELLFITKKTVPEALREVNYPNISNLSESMLYKIGSKIRQKYETQTSDKREIFRAVGLGESQIAENIKALTENPSAKIQLGANKLAADCIRLTQEPLQAHPGVNIIINCAPPTSAPLQPGHIAPAQVFIEGEQGQVIDLEPLKPKQITK